MSSRPHYTPDEDALIRAHYPTASNAEMQRFLPARTPYGIRQRAHKIGVQKRIDCWEVGKPLAEPVLAPLSDVERGYLAGIIDGEGCLRLSRNKTPGGTTTYHIQVSIANTSPLLLTWLLEKIPGSVYYTERRNSPRWRESYEWKLSGNRRAAAFLQEIAPYLIIKRAQAEALMGGYVLLSAEERETLYHQLSDLKRVS